MQSTDLDQRPVTCPRTGRLIRIQWKSTALWGMTVHWLRGLEMSLGWPLFYSISNNQSKDDGQAFVRQNALRLYNCYNHWPLFYSISNNQSKDDGQAFVRQNALRLYNCYNHCPCARPAHVAESWPLARIHVVQNNGSQMFMLRFKTLSMRNRHWQISRKIKT